MTLKTTSPPNESPSDAKIRAMREAYLDLLIKRNDDFKANCEFTTVILAVRDRPEPEAAWKTMKKSVDSLTVTFDANNSAEIYFEKKLAKSNCDRTE